MGRRLPPLNGLRAFEASARHLSFTRAAEELHVTPAAVSQQVKSLEEYFDTRLFHRLTRALRLTDAGQAMLPAVLQGFNSFSDATRIIDDVKATTRVRVSAPHSFGAQWLVPRMNHFRALHPEYEIRVESTDRCVDFDSENVDVALRYGLGDYPELVTERLFTEIAVPVCSPTVAGGNPPLLTPRDLRHYTLIHVHRVLIPDAEPGWPVWLRAAGVVDSDVTNGLWFSHKQMAIQAAIAGQGVALLPLALVNDDIARGRLVRLFPDTKALIRAFSYCLVYPEKYLEYPKVRDFRDWIVDEAASIRQRNAETNHVVC